jgi:hypothetical protein
LRADVSRAHIRLTPIRHRQRWCQRASRGRVIPEHFFLLIPGSWSNPARSDSLCSTTLDMWNRFSIFRNWYDHEPSRRRPLLEGRGPPQKMRVPIDRIVYTCPIPATGVDCSAALIRHRHPYPRARDHHSGDFHSFCEHCSTHMAGRTDDKQTPQRAPSATRSELDEAVDHATPDPQEAALEQQVRADEMIRSLQARLVQAESERVQAQDRQAQAEEIAEQERAKTGALAALTSQVLQAACEVLISAGRYDHLLQLGYLLRQFSHDQAVLTLSSNTSSLQAAHACADSEQGGIDEGGSGFTRSAEGDRGEHRTVSGQRCDLRIFGAAEAGSARACSTCAGLVSVCSPEFRENLTACWFQIGLLSASIHATKFYHSTP